MDDYGTLAIELRDDGTRRIARADPRIRIDGALLDGIRSGDTVSDWLALDGDVLTFRDDYGQRYTYRIRWDDYADGGYLAERD